MENVAVADVQSISSECPYASHFVEVLGSKMHYIDEGKGRVLLFLHGIPTSSYMWRNVIPYVSSVGRCIAPDLIGMGKSDKPNIAYRIFDYIQYVEAFIEALDLKDVTLVLHGWGSVMGFHYAMKHPERIAGLVFFESFLRPETKETLSFSLHHLCELLKSPEMTYDLVVHSDHFVEKFFPATVMRKLTPEEIAVYREPFSTPQDRKLLWQYLQDLPVGEEPLDVVDLIREYSKKLVDSTIPKLMLFGVPGYQTTIDTVCWAKDNLKNIKLVDVGEVLHCVPETNPSGLGEAIVSWMQEW